MTGQSDHGISPNKRLPSRPGGIVTFYCATDLYTHRDEIRGEAKAHEERLTFDLPAARRSHVNGQNSLNMRVILPRN